MLHFIVYVMFTYPSFLSLSWQYCCHFVDTGAVVVLKEEFQKNSHAPYPYYIMSNYLSIGLGVIIGNCVYYVKNMCISIRSLFVFIFSYVCSKFHIATKFLARHNIFCKMCLHVHYLPHEVIWLSRWSVSYLSRYSPELKRIFLFQFYMKVTKIKTFVFSWIYKLCVIPRHQSYVTLPPHIFARLPYFYQL
jgi:hypothetical protein